MTQEPEDEALEIDWLPLQMAIDAMSDGGLNLDDSEEMSHHLATLLAAFLKKQQQVDELPDDEVGEIAAWIAGAAIEIAVTIEDLPPFAVSDDAEDEDSDDEE